MESRVRPLTWAAAACFSAAAWSADATLPVQVDGTRFTAAVRSLRDLRDAGVVRQRYDYSCGAASLATLLSHGLGDTVGEDELLQAWLEPLSGQAIETLKKTGLSLAALQRLAQQRGHKAQGFRLHASQLARLTQPAIAFVRPGSQGHFVVFKGLRGDRVHLADPSIGNQRMPLYRFLDIWADASGQGVMLVVEPADGRWPAAHALQIATADRTPNERRSAEPWMDRGVQALTAAGTR